MQQKKALGTTDFTIWNSGTLGCSSEWFEHHCYSHDAKQNCIDRVKYLLKI